jgi:hypothetical protein
LKVELALEKGSQDLARARKGKAQVM